MKENQKYGAGGGGGGQESYDKDDAPAVSSIFLWPNTLLACKCSLPSFLISEAKNWVVKNAQELVGKYNSHEKSKMTKQMQEHEKNI